MGSSLVHLQRVVDIFNCFNGLEQKAVHGIKNSSDENYNSHRKLLFSEYQSKSDTIYSIFVSRLDLVELGNACDYAAESGYIDILKYVLAHGCPFDELTCAMAARGGQLEILKFLRNELNCPWDYRTVFIAAAMGHLDVLKWTIANSCESLR